MGAEKKWTRGRFSNFNPISTFFGGEVGSAPTTVKLWVATVVVPAVNGLESQVGARPELAPNETIFQPEAAFGNKLFRPRSQIAKRPSGRSGMQ